MSFLSQTLEFWICDNTDENDPIPVRQLTPSNTEISIIRKPWEKEIFFRATLSNSLIFLNSPGQDLDDFDYLYGKENGAPCASWLLLVKEYCDGLFVDLHYFYMYATDADWDISNCTVQFTTVPQDKYSCTLSILDEKPNLLADWVEKQVVRTTTGIFKTHISHEKIKIFIPNEGAGAFPLANPFELPSEPNSSIVTAGVPPEGPNWLMYQCKVFAPKLTNTSQGEVYLYFYRQTVWLREEMEFSSPPGGDWVAYDGKYVRQPRWVTEDVENDVRSVDDGGQVRYKAGYASGVDPCIWVTKSRYKKLLEPCILMDNGVLLKDAMGVFLKCNNASEIISNYFNINPDETQPDNSAYIYAEENFENVVMWQKSDVVRPYTANNASRFELTLGALLEDLKKINVYWDIDDDGNFRLEHWSYFKENLKIWDLTGTPFVLGLYRYTYVKDIPRTELYKYAPQTSIRFNHPTIIYKNRCVSKIDLTDDCQSMTADFVEVYTADKPQAHPDQIKAFLPNSPHISNTVVLYPGFPPEYISETTYETINYPVLLTESETDIGELDGFVIGSYITTADGSKCLIEHDIPSFFGGDYQDGTGSWTRIPNGAWSLSSMLLPCLRYNRWFKYAYIGKFGQVSINDFIPGRAIRKNVTLEVPHCCTDTWKPEDFVKIQLGVGFLESCTMLYPDRILSLEIVCSV